MMTQRRFVLCHIDSQISTTLTKIIFLSIVTSYIRWTCTYAYQHVSCQYRQQLTQYNLRSIKLYSKRYGYHSTVRDAYRLPTMSRSKTFSLSHSERLLSSSSSSSSISKEDNSESLSDATCNSMNDNSVAESVARWKAEAARIRLEAEKLDMALTLQKMKAIEDKLNNKAWIAKQSMNELDALSSQLQRLQEKLVVPSSSTTIATSTAKVTTTTKTLPMVRTKTNDNDGNGPNTSGRASSIRQQQFENEESSNLSSHPGNTDNYNIFGGAAKETTLNYNSNNNNELLQNVSGKEQITIEKLDGIEYRPASRGTTTSGTLVTQVLSSTQSKESSTSVKRPSSGTARTVVIPADSSSSSQSGAQTSAVGSVLDMKIPGVTVKQDGKNREKIVISLDTDSYNSKSAERSDVRMEEKRGLNGFDPVDLELYLPIAWNIERTMVNATDEEKVDAFRSSPVLQEHFQRKIAALLIQPMKDLQEIEVLKRQYLSSSSRVEKENLKRRIDKLQAYIEKEDPSLFSDTIYYKNLVPLSESERRQRLEAVSQLPSVLQSLYKKRNNIEFSDDIELAIELDYYEPQIQLLEQVKYLGPLNSSDAAQRNDIVLAIESLPVLTRDYVAQTVGLIPGNYTINDMLNQLCRNEDDIDDDDDDADDDRVEEMLKNAGLIKQSASSRWGSMFQNPGVITSAIQKVGGSRQKRNGYLSFVPNDVDDDDDLLDEYNDIGFVDRSRYIDEFYPAIARMERKHPSVEEINDFVATVIDKKAFMVTTKPERVVGGWYIRGRNLFEDSYNGNGGSRSVASSKLVERLQSSLDKSIKYKDKIQFFYIPDPSPLTDEDFEMEYVSEPLLVVTSKTDSKLFYGTVNPLTKGIINVLGLSSILLVAVATTALQPNAQLQWEQFATAAGTVVNNNVEIGNSLRIDDPTIVTNTDAFIAQLSVTVVQVFQSLVFVHFVHEVGHRIIAWRDKIKVGVPTFVPSIQLGLLGTITPLKSPPPSLKSLFDFAIAGPLLGLTISLLFLAIGLDVTSHMDGQQIAQLPVFPSYLLRSSELCGSMVEFFLGQGMITQIAKTGGGLLLTDDVLIPLHPLAISGFCGAVANALALLPLGNTDGGRIAITMFGRRGTYIVKQFTAIILCVIGLLGFDPSRILLIYLIYTQFWQKELEVPAINEVEELDFQRGVVGIVTAVLVVLTLVPMQ